METAYERAMRLRKKPEVIPSVAPTKPKAQLTIPDFWQRVNEKRKQGLSDTAILDGLSSTSSELKTNISQSRIQFSTDPTIKNDKDLLNYLSQGYSGKMPTVASVSLPPKKKELTPKEKVTTAAKEVIPKTAEFYKDVAVGGIKGALSTFLGLASLPKKGGEAWAGAITSLMRLDQTVLDKAKSIPSIKEKVKETGILEPTTAVQKGAMAGEQLAEFLIPGVAVSKLKYAKGLPGLAQKAIAEGSALAGVIAAQEGKVDKHTSSNFVIGAAFPIAAPIVGAVARAIPKLPIVGRLITPEAMWRSILKRTAGEAKKAPELEKRAADLGIAGTSRKAISSKLQAKIIQTEKQIDDIIDSIAFKVADKKIKPPIPMKYVSAIMDPIRKLKQTYAAIPGEEASVKVIDNILKQLAIKKPLNPLELHALKKSIYATIQKSYGKGMLDIPAKVEAQRELAAGIKKTLELIAPSLKKPLIREATLVETRIAIEKAISKTSTASILTVGDVVRGGLGFGVAGPGGIYALIGIKAAQQPVITSTTSKVLTHFNTLSPTVKVAFYNGLKYMTAKYDDIVEDIVGRE